MLLYLQQVWEKTQLILEFLGVTVDAGKNNIRGKEAEISNDGAKVKVFVIPTNEEIMIARDTKALAVK